MYLDVSISIGSNENFQEVTNFVSALGQFLEIGLNDNLAGVILFARHADIEFDVQDTLMLLIFPELLLALSTVIYQNGIVPVLIYLRLLDLLRTAGRRGGALRFRDDPNIPKIAVT